MSSIDKPDIKVGFNYAIGFFAFGLVVLILQKILMKVKAAA